MFGVLFVYPYKLHMLSVGVSLKFVGVVWYGAARSLHFPG